MSEFSSSVELLVQPSSSSLRDARKTIESELADIEVEVTASTTGASSQAAGGRRVAGKERAMSRQLLTKSNARLETAVDHLNYGIDLDEERNDILRELVNETESGNFTRARGGGSGLLGAGLLGIGAAGALFGGALSGLKDFKLEPPDIPSLRIKKPTWIPLTVPEPNWLPITVNDPTGTDTTKPTPGIDYSPSPNRNPDPRVNPMLEPTPRPQPGPNSKPHPRQVPSPDPVSIPDRRYTPDKINDIVDGPQPAPAPEGGGSPFRLAGAGDVIGGVAGLGAAGYAVKLLSDSGLASGGAGAGVGFPIATPEMFPKGSFMRTNPATGNEVAPSILTSRGRRERLGGVGEWLNEQLGTSKNRAQQQKDRRTNITVEQNITLDPSGMRDLKRQMEEKNRRLEKKIKEFERSFGGGGGLAR